MSDQLVLKADIESRVGVRSECHPSLASEISWLSVFVTHGIADLKRDSSNQQPLPHHRVITWGGDQHALTCMFTICPSPLLPDTIAVTSTRVSLPTKFRMHLSYFELCPVCACRSNFRDEAKGRRNRASRNINEKGAIMINPGATSESSYDRPTMTFDQQALRLNLGKAPAREGRSAPRATRCETLTCLF